MLTLNDWLIRKILTKIIKRAFYHKFGYDLKLSIKSLQVENNGEDVTINTVLTAGMKAIDAEKLIDEVI